MPASRTVFFQSMRMPGRFRSPRSSSTVIVCIASFSYYGTDDLYLNYLARFVKPDGLVGIAGEGLVREIEGPVPEHLREWWTQDVWCLHSASWWRSHWERTGIMDIELADTMPEGWQLWLDWHRAVAPDARLAANSPRRHSASLLPEPAAARNKTTKSFFM